MGRRRFQESAPSPVHSSGGKGRRRHDSSDSSSSPPRRGLGDVVKEPERSSTRGEILREIKNESPSPPRGRARQRGGSSSSSPSPARNRREVPDRTEGLERGRSKQTESYERSRGSEEVEGRRKREEGSKVVRSRPGPVAT